MARGRTVRSAYGVDRTLGEERAERAAGLVLLDRDRLEERRRMRMAMLARLLDRALNPANGGEVDAVLMRQMTADPDRGGLGVEGDADALSLEVLRAANAGFPVHIDVAVAEHARGKYRNRHEWTVSPRHPADEFGAGEFGGVEFMAAAHAIENLARIFDGDIIEVDALDRHVAGAQRLHAIVLAAGERQSQTRHGAPSRYVIPARSRRP